MQKIDVQLHLEEVARARAAWNAANREFREGLERVMALLVHEGARNFMSRNEIARHAKLTPHQVGDLMRRHGLNPKDGKRVLSELSARALVENAELMGITPEQMDLTSPLAYLPMGAELRKQLEADRMSQVNEFPETGQSL